LCQPALEKKKYFEAVLKQEGFTFMSISQVDKKYVLLGVLTLLIVMVAGLYIVKWNPYFYKAVSAASSHSLGDPIVGANSAVPNPSLGAALGYAGAYFVAVWKALVLGLLIGSGVQALLPREWLSRVLGRVGLRSTTTAAALAVPSMMCTCCAAPVAVGLRKCKASAGAAVAYLVGNPMLNPATIVFMGFVLGWQWSLLRVAVAVLLVFSVAHLADRLAPGETDVTRTPEVAGSEGLEASEEGNLFVRWAKVLGKMSLLLLPEYAVVVLVLGAVRAFIFPYIDPAVGGSLLVAVWLTIGGTLFVIPTAAEIPIVQGLMSAGLGPLGGGVLLTTLPAISLPSLLMAKQGLPNRVLIMVAGSVIVVGMLTGVAALVLGFS
jgi:uncharacterized membrane protein YraQ (UPF0718 family)